MREGNYRLPNVKKHRLYDPHVVIIGAGTSKAACPIDKNGKAVPVLRNVHEVLGLKNTEKENSKEYIRLLERIGGGEQHGICFTDGQPDKVL